MTISAAPKRVQKIDLKTECDYLVFVSSSGHCSLDCAYCIVNPIVKNKPTLAYSDFEFLFDCLDGKVFLMLSGKGDFFAGYRKPERLLERLLERDVEVALDINGVMIHEFSELNSSQLDKIRFINLTMHYTQLSIKRASNLWVRNARILIERKGGDRFLSGYVLSPHERASWQEGIEFYERTVFDPTGQPLVLIKDVNSLFDAELDGVVDELENRFSHLVEEVHQEDFATRFAEFDHVLCPAGSRYFRIWNDGRIEGCPHVDTLRDCGNVKNHEFRPRQGLFHCTQARHCDCNNIALAGKMTFPLAEQN